MSDEVELINDSIEVLDDSIEVLDVGSELVAVEVVDESQDSVYIIDEETSPQSVKVIDGGSVVPQREAQSKVADVVCVDLNNKVNNVEPVLIAPSHTKSPVLSRKESDSDICFVSRKRKRTHGKHAVPKLARIQSNDVLFTGISIIDQVLDMVPSVQRIQVEQIVSNFQEAKMQLDFATILEAVLAAVEKEADSDEASDANPGFECGCCYTNTVYGELAQCSAGHLFCVTCVRQLVKESTFGVGKLSVPCMDTNGCSGSFPISELRRVLPKELYEKLIERQQDEAVRTLESEGRLHRCSKPDCGFAMELDSSTVRVFHCLKCEAQTCVLCDKDWKDHIGLKCDEVEDTSQTAARRNVEEKMTAAMMRTCWKCKVPFAKVDGCNKMTCRCGAKMCYVCRKPIKNYNHFEGRGACPLQSSQAKADAQRVAKARSKALSQAKNNIAKGVKIAK